MSTLEAYFRIALTKGIGAARYRQLIAHFKTPEHTIAASISDLKNAGLNENQAQAVKFQKPANSKKISTILRSLESGHWQVILWGDPYYPPQLKEIHAAPTHLFIKGDVKWLCVPQLAIVGSRTPTPYGNDVTFQLGQHLAQAGLCVTSGMARGIDGIAHRAALSATNGNTIAVLGAGFQHLYPKRHQTLADEITERGCIISEFLPDTPPKAENFPRRNRIISGLSLGVLVTEARIKSGSLITAKYALEQNREVFAVPGSIHNSMSQGCHFLLKQGAKLVETVEDILEELRNFSAKGLYIQEEVQKKDSKEVLANHDLLDNLGFEVTPVDILVQRTDLSVDEVLTQLLDLEMQGFVAAVPGGYIKQRRS